ncbi:MAG: hypothetical protein F6K65_19890 [Moorea sp. SIO3C2]|nr:hypothetical protein [Moorena sp. SIO3C2]
MRSRSVALRANRISAEAEAFGHALRSRSGGLSATLKANGFAETLPERSVTVCQSRLLMLSRQRSAVSRQPLGDSTSSRVGLGH